MLFSQSKKIVMSFMMCAVGLQASAGDLICKGKSRAQRPVVAEIHAEMSLSNTAQLSNIDVDILKNGMRVHNFSKKKLALAITGQGAKALAKADISGNSEAYSVSLSLPAVGQGRGKIQIKELGTEDILAQVSVQCKSSAGLSVREKNDLCIAAARKYAAVKIKTYAAESALIDEDVQLEDARKFTGVYSLAFSPNEDCMNDITIKTRLIENPNKKPTCEAVEFEIGAQEC